MLPVKPHMGMHGTQISTCKMEYAITIVLPSMDCPSSTVLGMSFTSVVEVTVMYRVSSLLLTCLYYATNYAQNITHKYIQLVYTVHTCTCTFLIGDSMREDGGILGGRVIWWGIVWQSLRLRAQLCIIKVLRMGLTLGRGEWMVEMCQCRISTQVELHVDSNHLGSLVVNFLVLD